MKKLTLSVLCIVFISFAAIAQTEKNLTFSIGPEVGFATGSFSETHSTGTGGTAQAEYLLQEKLKATFTVGVLAYRGKSRPGISGNHPAQRLIPVRIGAKYYLAGNFYGGAQLGVTFRNNFAPYSGAAFAYSPIMLGYEFRMKSGQAIDATIKYDASSGSGGTIAAIGLRLAYIF